MARGGCGVVVGRWEGCYWSVERFQWLSQRSINDFIKNLVFNTLFHKINQDGRLRAHVAWLCVVAWRKLVSTEVHSKLQDCYHYLRLPPPHI